jgi:putative flippase GtrA
MRRPDNDSPTKCTSSAITDDHATPIVLILFIAVGGTAALAFILICTLLSDVFGARPAVASLIGYGVAIPPVYWAQKAITFRSRAFHRVAFPKYLTVQVIGNVLAVTLGGSVKAIRLFRPGNVHHRGVRCEHDQFFRPEIPDIFGAMTGRPAARRNVASPCALRDLHQHH